MGRRLNLEEIGRLAGVSRSTVSRVVNGSPHVSDAAKAKVEAVVARTGYRPDAAARSLAANRTNERFVEPPQDACEPGHAERAPSSGGSVVCASCGATIGART